MKKLVPSRSHSRILDEGLNMLSVSGLNGVTFGTLADAVGMSKSGLFSHFRSKEDIQIRLLAHANELASATVAAQSSLEAPALDRLTTLMRNWLGWASRAGLRGGCPIAAALFELDDLDGEVRLQVAAIGAAQQAMLTSIVVDAVAERALRLDTDVEQFVWDLRCIYLGHHVSSRFDKDPKADERAWHSFEMVVQRFRS